MSEAELVLEDWMLNDHSLDSPDLLELLKEDFESPLKLEKWMICKEPWCKKKQ